MPNDVDADVINVSGRIALALLAAEHVAPLLAPHPSTRALVEGAVREDWAWMETRAVNLGELYWSCMPRLMEEDARLGGDALLPVLHCALYAQTYFFWSAEGVTNLESPGTVLGLGNDISDVDESSLTNCLELAVDVSPHPQQTAEWLDRLIARMEREQRKTPDNITGGRLRRADYDVPAFPG